MLCENYSVIITCKGIIKQTQRQDLFSNQLVNLGFGHRRDILEVFVMQGINLTAFNHSAITHKDHLMHAKPFGQRLNLLTNGLRVLGVSVKHINRISK